MCTLRLKLHFNVLYIPMATSFKASGLKEPAKKQPNFIADQSQFSSVLSALIHELKLSGRGAGHPTPPHLEPIVPYLGNGLEI